MFVMSKPMRIPSLLFSLLLTLQGQAEIPGTTTAAFRPESLKRIDTVILEAIRQKKLPGGVLWLQGNGEVYRKAYGKRALVPLDEDMSINTIFDAASLTKVVATTPCILKLIENSKIKLEDKASKFLPELTGDPNKARITIRHLLTHTSGLLPGIRKGYDWSGRATGIALACSEPSVGHAGYDHRYSDINFILLGEVVRRISGKPLSVFAQETIFGPLKMKETFFLPAETHRSRIAPTTLMADGSILRGVVHDPTAGAMAGEAGHAGLFTSAHDLSRFARMILQGGKLQETRILQPETVKLMSSVQTPERIAVRRGLGFDIDSPYAGPRGKIFPLGSFGHSGWTGTSLWLDPFSQTTVIFLSNRNHPSGGDVRKLRSQVGTLAAEATGFDFTTVSNALPQVTEQEKSALREKIQYPVGNVLSGIDVLIASDFAPLNGLRVGLITNPTGLNRDRRSTIDLLHGAPSVKLVSLFGPEHGIRGTRDGKVEDGFDDRTGLPVRSLYAGKDRRKPSPEHLKEIDALVFDMQDIGCRFYTYLSTMGLAMEAAKEAGIRFIVLDRVNPLGGIKVAGPLRDGEQKFVAFHDIPVQHGMTAGELAKLYQSELYPELDLLVVPLRHWKRSMRFDETGLPWVKPSPNMPNLAAATLYPGIGLLEFTNLSVGRGTSLPFEIVGAPYIVADDLALHLTSRKLPGLEFVPIRFTPESSVFEGEECGGVRILLKDPSLCESPRLGPALGQSLRKLYPDHWETGKLNTLLCHPSTERAILNQHPHASIVMEWEKDLDCFRERCRNFLLY
ncbi:MAG TPA: hypothetical protein DD438_01315 [Verrucomicrobiales bacterium]|nr:hypothetical protein [Verrucomicrobiales bacterium]